MNTSLKELNSINSIFSPIDVGELPDGPDSVPGYVSDARFRQQGAVFMLSIKKKKNVYKYVLRVTHDPQKGHGLQMIIPTWVKDMLALTDEHNHYLRNFKIPIDMVKETRENFFKQDGILHNKLLQGMPDDFFFDDKKKWVYYDRGFTTRDAPPLWYLLNHSSSFTMSLLRKDEAFHLDSGKILEKIMKFKTSPIVSLDGDNFFIPLTIFYSHAVEYRLTNDIKPFYEGSLIDDYKKKLSEYWNRKASFEHRLRYFLNHFNLLNNLPDNFHRFHIKSPDDLHAVKSFSVNMNKLFPYRVRLYFLDQTFFDTVVKELHVDTEEEFKIIFKHIMSNMRIFNKYRARWTNDNFDKSLTDEEKEEEIERRDFIADIFPLRSLTGLFLHLEFIVQQLHVRAEKDFHAILFEIRQDRQFEDRWRFGTQDFLSSIFPSRVKLYDYELQIHDKNFFDFVVGTLRIDTEKDLSLVVDTLDTLDTLDNIDDLVLIKLLIELFPFRVQTRLMFTGRYFNKLCNLFSKDVDIDGFKFLIDYMEAHYKGTVSGTFKERWLSR